MAHHILVVDDDLDLLEMYRLFLEDVGYHVTFSQTTFEDVTVVEHLHPDLVLLDVMVSQRQDGLCLLERLRAYPPTHSLPVIICTAFTAPGVRERIESFQQQGIPVVYKPFDVEDLLATIRQVLGIDGQEVVLSL